MERGGGCLSTFDKGRRMAGEMNMEGSDGGGQLEPGAYTEGKGGLCACMCLLLCICFAFSHCFLIVPSIFDLGTHPRIYLHLPIPPPHHLSALD